MKRAMVLPVFLLAACSAGPGPADGERAPDFSATDEAGAPVAGRSLWAGGDVLLIFMTSW